MNLRLFFCIGFISSLICTVKAQLRPPRITEHPNDVVVKKHEPATLNCKADGKPTPTIEWFKDGELVHNTANRMVLPSGSLFFLHVIHNKRDGDTGIYWCLAKNEVGKTKSRNASLEVALLRDEFKVMPKNVRVASGESAVMECAPPRGYPEPNISWRRNSEKINAGSGRLRIIGTGNLMISEVRPGDEGSYTCVAENMVGTRESPPAHLNVQVKPYFIRGPEDVTALSDESVEFHCKVGGDPTPTITWKRRDGKMPIGRAQILEDKALKIRHVTPADEGVYLCEVENPVGTITSSATLIVHSRPAFLETPKDVRVSLNGIAKLECVATGNPPPTVFWTREGNQVLMFPGKTHGRFSVSSEGTLTITGVRKEDRGYYVCSALSVVGSSMAKAYIAVSAAADVPPPIIRLGPANQTLPLDTVAMLPCEAMGTPQPMIKWLINNNPLPLHDPRFVILDSGTLQIDALRPSDSGIYTCIVSSESGETSRSASLSVQSPRNPNIEFHRMPDHSSFPGAPSKPVFINATETSLTIAWRKNSKSGASQLIGYTIEYYNSDTQSGWTIAGFRVKGDVYTIDNLRSDSRYVFIVRAENSHGMGPQSVISDEMKTLGLSSHSAPEYDIEEARIRLKECSIELKDVRAMSSTAVKLFWNIHGTQEFIEGFYIRYRDMTNGGAIHKYNMVTVPNAGASTFVLSDLDKYSKYEFFLVPFYKSVEGPPSNTRIVQTLEDVPSASPENLRVRLNNLTCAIVEWSPPPQHEQNGQLLGYNIQIAGNGSALHSNITTNSTTFSVTLYNLTSGAIYSIRALTYTSVGSGPFTSPVALRMDRSFLYPDIDDGPAANSLDNSYFDGVAKQTWFIVIVILVIIITGTAVVMLGLYMRKKLSCKKAMTTNLTVPLHKSEEVSRSGFNGNTREALWINHGWRPNDKDANTAKQLLNNCSPNDINNSYSSAFVADYCSVNAPDYAEVDTHNMTTFYKKDSYIQSVPAPYATTTLINTSQSRHGGSVRDQKSTSGSEELGSRKSEKQILFDHNDDGAMEHLLSEQHAKSPSDSGSYTTDEYGMPVRKKSKHRQPNMSFRPSPPIHGGTNSNHISKASIVNWTDLIPPPPENPPSDFDTPPDTPSMNGNIRSMNGNRQGFVRVQLPPKSYIHSGAGRSPLITRSYQPSPVNSRHSLSSPRSTLTRNKKVSDVMASAANDAAVQMQHGNRNHLPAFFQRFQQNQGSMISQYAPSNMTPHIITNPLMDRAIQSSLPSLMDESQDNKNQVTVGSYQRLEMDSETECNNAKKRSPASSVGDGDTTDYAHCDDGSGESHRSSDGEDQESSFYAEAEYSNCIPKPDENPGFTFNEKSFVIEPQSHQNKKFRHHQRVPLPNFRSTSPYSTDSNMSNMIQKSRHPPKVKKKPGNDRTNNQLPSPSSGSEYTPSYDNINQSDLISHYHQRQSQVPMSLQNGISNDFSSTKFPSYNRPVFSGMNSKSVSTNNDKNHFSNLLSSPSSVKEPFSLKPLSFRFDDRDTPIV